MRNRIVVRSFIPCLRSLVWLGVAALCLLSTIPPAARAAVVVDVYVVDNDFVSSPGGLHFNPTISLGDTIHWIWDSVNLAPHSTTSAAGQAEVWDSGLHSPSFTYDHTFTQAERSITTVSYMDSTRVEATWEACRVPSP
jgi:plastocyanin